VYNTNLMTSVMRPDPRYELALASQVPHTQTEHPDTSAVAVTLFKVVTEDTVIEATHSAYNRFSTLLIADHS